MHCLHVQTHSNHLFRGEVVQAKIPLIKLFTILSLTLTHLGRFSLLLRQNVKLYEIRGSSWTCTEDTQSLYISLPYAKTGTGRTRSSLFFLLSRSFRAVLCNEGEIQREKGSSGSRLVRKHLIFMAAAEKGKSPAWWVGGPHTQTHACNQHYHISNAYLYKRDPMNFHRLFCAVPFQDRTGLLNEQQDIQEEFTKLKEEQFVNIDFTNISAYFLQSADFFYLFQFV